MPASLITYLVPKTHVTLALIFQQQKDISTISFERKYYIFNVWNLIMVYRDSVFFLMEGKGSNISLIYVAIYV